MPYQSKVTVLGRRCSTLTYAKSLNRENINYFFFKRNPSSEQFGTKMSNCIKIFNFPIKLLKTGFVPNDKWRQAPGFNLLHHM